MAPLLAAMASTGPIGALVVAMSNIALALERARDAWNDLQNGRRMANDDPSSDSARARLGPMNRTADTGGFHYTGQALPPQ